MPFIFRQGSDITVELDATDGDVADVASVEASMRRVRRGRVRADETAIIFTVTDRPAAGQYPDGWTCHLDAPPVDLEVGDYRLDAKLNYVGGGEKITDQSAVIRIERGGVW